MRRRRLFRGLLASALALLVACAVDATSAFSETLRPWWSVAVGERPSVLPEKGEGQLTITAANLGDAATSGLVKIAAHVPAGLKVTGISGHGGGPSALSRGPLSCRFEELVCEFEQYSRVNEEGKTEFVAQSLPPFEAIEVVLTVQVKTAKTGAVVSATVSGGGAARTVSASHTITVGGTGRFGIEEYRFVPEEAGGTIDTQAGSHPFQVSSFFALTSQTPDAKGEPRSFALSRNIVAELPTGFVGNPTPFAQCTETQFLDQHEVEGGILVNECPESTAIGVATITFTEPHNVGFATINAPIFNMVPDRGEPARFAFKAAGIVAAYLDTSVNSGGNYAVNVGSFQIPQIQWLLGVRLTFWGVPGDKRHDHQRGWNCLQEIGGPSACPSTEAAAPPPFLAMPTSCKEPFVSTLHADSWGSSAKPVETAEPVTYTLPELVDGCDHLPFSPSIGVAPDIPDASSPSGLTVDVHVPQQAELNAESLAESALKDTTVTLPAGVALNPAGADGLRACSVGEIGFTGVEEGGVGRDLFTAGLPVPFCPDASKVGTVTIHTPLLAHPLEGAVYLATQNANPFGSLIAMYLVAQDPVSGTLIKLAGEVKPDPVTGQIVTTFKNTPHLPFEDLELHFYGGERAPLGTPARCGSYTTSAMFAPWSGNGAATPSSAFNVTSGPNGTPCPGGSLPFAPELTAGTTSIQAGGFSPFTMTMSRQDGNQNLQAISLRMPPGLSGLLNGVELCPEPQASQGLCGPNSLIGETTVSVGLGSEPFSVKGGRVYITGPYEGAPFGLSIVNPAKAGPFDLEKNTPCDCVLVRAKIEVDPITAQLTVTSDNEGPYKIPTILDGIPLQIKHVNVTIDRPGFTVNPTNCEPLALHGAISSSDGQRSEVGASFQVTNCAALGFKPVFNASTSGRTSRRNGASLTVTLTYPKNVLGKSANIRSVKVNLPKQLPSRLETLQKACLDRVFNSNPAACPVASRVGKAKAVTPILPVPLEGPTYFVSHGAREFPDLIVVLEGYGITVDLRGQTFISKKGITSSTFRTVPDQPVTSFELTLPQGPFSALTNNGNLCKVKGGLKIPTSLTAQNGLVIHETNVIRVTGCPKAESHHKYHSKHQKQKHKKHK